MVLTRHDVESHGSDTMVIDCDAWLSGCYGDAWVFKTPLNANFVKEDFKFCVGNAPHCDNLMMGIMSRHYHTYSWGSRYRIFHYDLCRNTANFADKLKQYPKTVDHRPEQRRAEHRNIPTMQPWSWLLENRYPPLVTYSWFDIYATDPAHHAPKIFP